MKNYKSLMGFGASLLLFVALSPYIAFSEDSVGGSCHLTQSGGRYTIVCEGVGDIETVYDYQTNHVYIIENCEQLKSDLLVAINSCNASFGSILSNVDDAENYASNIDSLSSAVIDETEMTQDFLGDVVNYQLPSLYNSLSSIRSLSEQNIYNLNNLSNQVSDIECGDCSSGSGGSGSCGCDLSGVLNLLDQILTTLNTSEDYLEFIKNKWDWLQTAIGRYFMEGTGLSYRSFAITGSLNGPTRFLYYVNSTADDNSTSVRNLLWNLGYTSAHGLSAANNSLFFTGKYVISISNRLEFAINYLQSISNTLVLSYDAQTNHFSFFREMSVQDSPMVDYMDYSSTMTRYEFLTNHYIRLTENSYADMTESEKSKTNWFSRVETLLAALVFQDAEQTNTVDISFGEQDRQRIIDGLDGLESTSSSRIQLMNDVGRGLISVLSDLDSSFSSAIELPSEVDLVTLPDSSDSRSSTSITFQTSAIRNLVEVCHCATTLAWCFGGLWLFYLFVSWSVKTSYSLVVFCWSVFSGVFGGGK